MLLLDEAAPGAASTAFQVLHPPEIRAAELARRALALGARRFAVLAPESPSGRRLGEAFARAVTAGGGRITAQATYPSGSSAFSAPVARIKRASVRGDLRRRRCLPPGTDRARAGLRRSVVAALRLARPGTSRPRRAPAPARACCCHPRWAPGPQLLRNAGRYVQGALLAPGFFADADDPRTSAFVGQFRTLYGQDPGATDAYGYDAFRLLVNAILRGGKSRADLLRTLAADPFEGVTGTIKFGPDHTRIDPPPIYVVVGRQHPRLALIAGACARAALAQQRQGLAGEARQRHLGDASALPSQRPSGGASPRAGDPEHGGGDVPVGEDVADRAQRFGSPRDGQPGLRAASAAAAASCPGPRGQARRCRPATCPGPARTSSTRPRARPPHRPAAPPAWAAFASAPAARAARPARRAPQWLSTGQPPQRGDVGVQTVAPRSITAWAKSPGRSAGTSVSARARSRSRTAG